MFLRHFSRRTLYAATVLLAALAGVILLAACQTTQPTQYLLEVTREVTRVVVVTPTPGDGATVADAPTSAPTPQPDSAGGAQDAPASTPSPTADPIPTPITNQIIVSELAFQNGRAFWLEPQREIWVLVEASEGANEGAWIIRDDTWTEDQPPFDPEIEPPEEGLFQPERGFGKLWRENTDIREALGWAIESEEGHVTTYTYVFRGDVVDGEFVEQPGYHTLVSKTGITYLFDESNGTWRQLPSESAES